jgi:hypothetical protein
MKIDLRKPLKKRQYAAVYQDKADDNEELLLKKMNKLIIEHKDRPSGGSIRRFASQLTRGQKVSKPKTFAL